RLRRDGEELGEDRLAGRVQQERALSILARAAYRAEQMTEQAARELRRVNHRHDLRLRLLRAEPPHGSLRAHPADFLGRIEIGEGACGRVPVIPLERLAALRDDAAADRVAARRISADETVAVRIPAP